MQAVIIAGGKGTRLRALTATIPKLLLPLAKKPLIDYQIDYLKKNDCDNIIICAGFLGDKVKEYIDRKDYGIQLRLSIENKPLGTAGPLHLVKHRVENEFLVLFGDIYTTINLRKMLKFHRQKRADATLALHRSDHPQDSTVVKIDKNRRLLSFTEKPGKNWKNYGNLTATSLYILKKNVLNFIAKNREIDFAKDVFPKMMRARRKLFGYITQEYAKDIGTRGRYEEVQQYVKIAKK